MKISGSKKRWSTITVDLTKTETARSSSLYAYLVVHLRQSGYMLKGAQPKVSNQTNTRQDLQRILLTIYQHATNEEESTVYEFDGEVMSIFVISENDKSEACMNRI